MRFLLVFVGLSMLTYLTARDAIHGRVTLLGILPVLILALAVIFHKEINAKLKSLTEKIDAKAAEMDSEEVRSKENPAPSQMLSGRVADWDLLGEEVTALSVPDRNRFLRVSYQDKEWPTELFWNEHAAVSVGDTLLIVYRVTNAEAGVEKTPENSFLTVVVSMDSFYLLPG